MTPDKHCRLSPSSSERWLACPYSAQTDLPRFTNEAAEKGTSLHSLAGDVLAGRATTDGLKPKDVRAIDMYVDHVHANGGEYLVEHFWESIAIDDFGGTADCVIFKHGKIAVYDFKSGKWPVEAEDNTQLLSYASIVAEQMDVDGFYGVIVQPNSKDGRKVKATEYSLEQVSEHHENVKIAAVSDHKQVGDHCMFCPLRRADMCDEGAAEARRKGWTYK
jgi:hypothetical protein